MLEDLCLKNKNIFARNNNNSRNNNNTMMFKAYVVYVIVYLLISGSQCMNSANKQSTSKQQAPGQQSQGRLVKPNFQASSSKQGQSKADTEFINNALDTMKQVDNMFKIRSCITNARNKASQLLYTKGANHFAVSWISMYSRYCSIKRNLLGDKVVNNFPFRLNKELRCMYHPRRDNRIQRVFQRVANIIDQSLQIMGGPVLHQNLYRGMTFNPYEGQHAFVEEGFFSASLSMDVALRFAKGNILMIVDEMYGLEIADYAEDRFKVQQEVLGLTNSFFEVTDRITDSAEIDKLFPNYRQKPTEVIHVHQRHHVNVDQFLDIQHQNSAQYCQP